MARKTKPRLDPEEVARRLDDLYAELPKLDCKGKCWKCCAAVMMAPGERDRVKREYGVELPTVPQMRAEGRELCPALKSHRCTVYTARPMMCRLWGIEEGMRCPYGCVPDGGWMTEQEAIGFWTRAYAIAGWPVEKEGNLTPTQVQARLRAWEAKWRKLPPERRARIQPDPDHAPPARRGLLGRLRRG